MPPELLWGAGIGFHPCVQMPGSGVVDIYAEIPVYDQVQ
jgi:hypothetical protein